MNFAPLFSTGLITVTASQPLFTHPSPQDQTVFLALPRSTRHDMIPLLGCVWERVAVTPLGLTFLRLPRPTHSSSTPTPLRPGCPDLGSPHPCGVLSTTRGLSVHRRGHPLPKAVHAPLRPVLLPEGPLRGRLDPRLAVPTRSFSRRLHGYRSVGNAQPWSPLSPMLTKLMTRSVRPRRRSRGPPSSSSSPAMAW